MTDVATRIEAGREAVLLASLVCRQVQSAPGPVREITKDDRSPVTVADHAAQAIVAWVLRERLGSEVLVGEESSSFLRQEEHRPHLDATLAAVQQLWPEWTEDDLLRAIDMGRGDARHAAFWTLDPIDGTRGFLRGQQYAVSLAYIDAGEPIIGVMGCPALARDFGAGVESADPRGCLYVAARGAGVTEEFCTESGGERTSVTRPVHGEGEPITVCSSVEESHSDLGGVGRVLAAIGAEPEVLRLDSQAKYAVVARGQADAYLRLPTRKGYVERIWDHAAGAVVAGECGCTVSDAHGNPLDFSCGEGLERNRGILVATPRAHGAIVEAVRTLGLV